MTDEELIVKAREHGRLLTSEPTFDRALLAPKPQIREFAIVYFKANNNAQLEIYLDKHTGAFVGANTSARSDSVRTQNTPASKIVTLVDVLNAYSNPTTSQIWLVPGTLDDRNDEVEFPGEFAGMHITPYLLKRGICLGTYLADSQHAANKTKAIVEDIRRKFESQGFMVALHDDVDD